MLCMPTVVQAERRNGTTVQENDVDQLWIQILFCITSISATYWSSMVIFLKVASFFVNLMQLIIILHSVYILICMYILWSFAVVWKVTIYVACGWCDYYNQMCCFIVSLKYKCNVRYFSQKWIFHKVTNHWLDTTHSTENNARLTQKMHVSQSSRMFFWLRKIVQGSKYNTNTN